MADKATKGVEEERDAVISRALAALPPQEAMRLGAAGIDAQHVLLDLLDYVTCGERMEDPRRGAIDALARRLYDARIPWEITGALCETLGRSCCEHLEGKVDGPEPAAIYRRLMDVQTRLFQAYLNGEEEKQARMGRLQREIDRFPDTIAATLDPATLAKAGLAKLKALAGAEQGIFFTIDRDRRLLPVVGDLAREGMEPSPLPLGEGEARVLLEQGEPYLEGDASYPDCLREFCESRNLVSVLLLPVVARGRTNAVILLSASQALPGFTPDQVEIAASFVSRMAVAMENAELHSKEQHKIKETVALLEIARAINSTLDLREILEKAVQMTVDLCGVVQCVVYLLDSDRFIPGAYGGFINDILWEREGEAGFAVDSLQEEVRTLLERGRPVAISCQDAGFLLPVDDMYEHGVDLVLMFPLTSKQILTGIFVLFYPRVSDELPREEVEVVGAIAAQASLAIENAALYEDIERSYFSTVRALARAIEVKDPYTHGHSERVTEYALMIAEAMQLDERDKQKLKYAATLHDIGKIGIAGRVLNKPGALTEEEYTHVKTHPHLGDSIIEPVEFLQGPRPIILHHHERFDGTGYPAGLRGASIPLCARILSVADAFEAMRSDRPYRRALPVELARQELRRNSGTQFDPEVVEVFLYILDRYSGDPVNR